MSKYKSLYDIEKNDTCPLCEEEGADVSFGTCRRRRTCRVCNGKGWNRAIVQPYVQTCINCDGTRLDRVWFEMHDVDRTQPIFSEMRRRSKESVLKEIEELKESDIRIDEESLEKFKKNATIFPDHQWDEEEIEERRKEINKEMAMVALFPGIIMTILMWVAHGTLWLGLISGFMIWASLYKSL